MASFEDKTRVMLAVVFTSVLVMTGLNVFYSNERIKESNRYFCDIVMTVNDAYRDSPTPPQTELGKKLQQQYADLERRLQCRR